MKKLDTKISDDVISVLANMTFEGKYARIIDQLNRKTYQKVDEVLQSAGGEWNRKAKAHVFSEDAEPIIRGLIGGGTFLHANALDFFPTPADLADRLVADIKEPKYLLEPSAGEGALVDAILRRWPVTDIVAVEARPDLSGKLTDKYDDVRRSKIDILHGDFLDVNFIHRFDTVVMNPPFANQSDIDHVTRAIELLEDGGQLRAIMSISVTQRKNKKTKAFMYLLDQYPYEIEEVEDGAFKQSGTMVKTVIVRLTKDLVD